MQLPSVSSKWFSCSFLVVLEFELQASRLIVRYFMLDHVSRVFYSGYFRCAPPHPAFVLVGFCKHFAQAGLEPQSSLSQPPK
jgi:hypothetical protein